MRLLRGIAKEQGRCVVIVSHDQRIRDIADRVLWLEDGAFKDMVTMATDPLCGMAVERERATTAVEDGETLYFCSKRCRDEYLSALGGRWRGLTGIGRAILDRMSAAEHQSGTQRANHAAKESS